MGNEQWGHAHVHSEFSSLDAISNVESLVERAAKYKQPFLALTDHGNMSGIVQLYKAGAKYGVKVFPGIEGYLTVDTIDDSKEAGKLPRYHIGILALNLDGYKSLVDLSSLSHTRPRFNRFPRFDLEDLASFSNPNVAILTGCYFGLVQQKLVREGYDAAKRIVEMYSRWFPNTFVEIQNHHIDHSEQKDEGEFIAEFQSDEAICTALVKIAKELDLPVMATQDSHYLEQKQKLAHCVTGSTKVTGLGPNNGKTVEWYHNILHGAVDAIPGECESCGTDLIENCNWNVYRTREKSGSLVQISSGKWYATIRLRGKRPKSPAGSKSDAIAWLEEKRLLIYDKWLCKKCYHTRYMFQRNGGTKIVGRNTDEKLSLQKMVDVVYNGKRHVLTIKTKSGKAITSTHDHRHLTIKGWKRADELTTDDKLVTYEPLSYRYNSKHRPSEIVKKIVKSRAGYKCESCKSPYINSETHQVAHKDYTSNKASNLMLLCVACHREYDTDTRAGAWTNPVGAASSKVISVVIELSQQHVFDVVMDSEDHSWLGNGIVTHNSLMKRMVYGGDDGVNEFPGDSFHLATTEWIEEHHDPRHWKKALKGAAHLLELHDLQIPPLDNYKPDIPTVKKNPQAWLEKRCWKQLDKFEKAGLLVKNKKAYAKQIKHELETIEFLGQAGYFTIWDQVMKFCREETICVEARGSANGSVICYLLEITQTDPLQWGLLFERFLSRDRKKPPDIDLDVEDNRRDDVIAMLESAFGVAKIGTYSVLGSRDSDDRGSILVTYNSYLRRKIGNHIFTPKYGGKGLESIEAVKSVSNADYKGVRQLSRLSVKKSYGVHPSAVLLNGDKQKITDYVPTMLVASSNTKVAQFIGDDVEELGYLKNDILGQKTLRIMRRCQELINVKNPTDFRWIPLDDKATCKYLSQGKTDNGVFQFEGYSMAVGARSLKIKSTYDCVLAGALFRPACIASGVTQSYIDRRFDSSQRKVEHPHPAFEEVLKPTYGLVIFQEQVLEIMRRLGLDYEGINLFFKIIKDSGKGATGRNIERLAEVKKQWADLCEENSIDDPDWAWEYIEGYVSYGFNKAHAAGYGVRSYRVAYLKVHHPLEFHAALLETWSGAKKEPGYIRETRNVGIRLLPPDVNYSNALWTIDEEKGAIRKGLASIKGIGVTAGGEIASNRPYETIEELIEANSARAVSGAPRFLKEGIFSGILEKLKSAGALNSLGYGRDE